MKPATYQKRVNATGKLHRLLKELENAIEEATCLGCTVNSELVDGRLNLQVIIPFDDTSKK